MNDLHFSLTKFQELVGSELWFLVIVTASLCVILLALLNFGVIRGER